MEQSLRIALPSGPEVSAVLTRAAEDPQPWCLVYAPGAGSSLTDPFGIFLSETLPGSGVAVLRFQFPYAEAGRRLPDRTPVLEATWQAAIDVARPYTSHLVVGGRSMGGRIASHVVAAGTTVDAIALFAYPLRAPGRTHAPRDAHFPNLAAPALFCSGTRDTFGTPDELLAAANRCPNAVVHFLEGADHGFAIRRATGRTQLDIWREATDALLNWLRVAVR